MSPVPRPGDGGGPTMRYVLYLDLDAFYVSCELRERPELTGTPVIVGPDPKRGPTRGVVLSASYEARAKGVRSAMPVRQADLLCPEATWIPPDFDKYARVSGEVLAFLGRRFPRVRPMSIDEAALPVEVADPEEAGRMARELQAALRAEVGLPASIGAATTRLVAKIATDRAKPAGVVVVGPTPLDVAQFLGPLGVRVVPGVGPKTEELLLKEGFRTLADLARGATPGLRHKLGAFGDELVQLARGTPPEEDEEETGLPRSRSVDRTLESDSDDLAVLSETLRTMAESLAAALREERLGYQTVTVAVRWEEFTRVQRSHTLPQIQTGAPPLAAAAEKLLREIWAHERGGSQRRARLLSVRAERLRPLRGRQANLDRFLSAPVK